MMLPDQIQSFERSIEVLNPIERSKIEPGQPNGGPYLSAATASLP